MWAAAEPGIVNHWPPVYSHQSTKTDRHRLPSSKDWSVAKYLITGGCGFIGSHLAAALLATGDSVHVLDNLSGGRREALPAGAQLTIGDIADAETVRAVMEGCDGCFHLAARTAIQDSITDWLGTHRSNQTGSVTIFDSSRQFPRPIPVVYASSASVYGDNSALPLPETATVAPLTAYAADKLGTEMHARAAWHSHGVPNIGLRFFNVYGPFDRDSSTANAGVVAAFATRIAQGMPISIHGNGQQVRDFIHVSDVVAHLRAAMNAMTGEASIYNVCSGRPTTILQLAELLGTLAARPPQLQFMPSRTGDIRDSLGDPSQATAAFGITAAVPLDEGLRGMLEHLFSRSGPAPT